MMRKLFAIAVLAGALAGPAFAAEPVKLSGSELDKVTAAWGKTYISKDYSKDYSKTYNKTFKNYNSGNQGVANQLVQQQNTNSMDASGNAFGTPPF